MIVARITYLNGPISNAETDLFGRAWAKLIHCAQTLASSACVTD
jgi:hypothetical protein